MLPYLAIALGISLAINIVLFLIAFRYKTDKLTDASYSLSFISLALFGLLTSSLGAIKWLLFLMVLVWALRLGTFLVIRVLHNKKDKRFDGMRENFVKFGKFWIAQAVSAWVILLPTLIVFPKKDFNFSPTFWLGLVVWLGALVIETVADWQKYQFSKQPKNKNKWIDSGIWSYSRHPNYFGEIMVWVGVYLCVLPSLRGVEILIALASPVLIASLLIFVSGVPILEKSADKRWGNNPGYRKYKKQTNLLIPLPKRS